MRNKSKKYYKEGIINPCILLENRVRKKLIIRYDKPLWYHDVKMINDIIYNEKTHYVELFKENLIYEDINEFLKRFYNINEISIKLPKILLFYEKYSKIYANYTVIPESKYMYKNIKRKQKMIDQMQNSDNEEEEDEDEEGENLPNKIFNTNVMESINSFTMSIYANTSNSKNTNSEVSVNHLINRIDNYERNAQKIKVRNQNKRKNNINYSNKNKLINTSKINNNSNLKNKIIQIGDSMNRRVISAIFTKSKINEKSNINNKNLSNKNLQNQKKNSKMILKENFSKPDNKMIMSTMSTISPKLKGKIFSSPSSGPSSNKNILNKKKYNSPTISNNNSRRESNIKKIFSNPIKNNPKTQREYYTSKLFSKNKNEILKVNGKININSNNKNIKSNSKTKENNSIINNYNIVNNFQNGSTQINIFTGNELINSLHLHANSVFNSSNFNNRTSSSPIHKKNKSNNNMTYNTKQKSIAKPKKQKFDLNLRKIIHKQIIDSEASTERNFINKNFLEKLGKYFTNHNNKSESRINTTSINKISVNESKLITKVINKHPSYRKSNQKAFNEKIILNNKKNKIVNQNSRLSNSNNNIIKKTMKTQHTNLNNDKLTIKNTHDLNMLFNRNGKFSLNSERNNGTKITFNK